MRTLGIGAVLAAAGFGAGALLTAEEVREPSGTRSPVDVDLAGAAYDPELGCVVVEHRVRGNVVDAPCYSPQYVANAVAACDAAGVACIRSAEWAKAKALLIGAGRKLPPPRTADELAGTPGAPAGP